MSKTFICRGCSWLCIVKVLSDVAPYPQGCQYNVTPALIHAYPFQWYKEDRL